MVKGKYKFGPDAGKPQDLMRAVLRSPHTRAICLFRFCFGQVAERVRHASCRGACAAKAIQKMRPSAEPGLI